jgi:outer membrane protein
VFYIVNLNHASEIQIQLKDPPTTGTLICRLYRTANTFGDLREAWRTEKFILDTDNKYRIGDLPAGSYAMVLFLDKNNNGALDKNFMGIPNEPIAFSNQYRPKGPPNFRQAQFTLQQDEIHTEVVDLGQVLGKRGRLGVGLGVIGRSSPYRNYDGGVYRVIPIVTYIGKQFQIMGPLLRCGLIGSGNYRLAATLGYRMGVYDEENSPDLQGMGDRRDTAMLGLSLQADLWGGLQTTLSYQHDVLDQIGGGSTQCSLGKTFQWDRVRLKPNISLNWLSSKLTNYDYGVNPTQATANRPAYLPGESWSSEIGLGAGFEITRNWVINFSLNAEFFDSNVRASPIVSKDYVLKGFLAVNYTF